MLQHFVEFSIDKEVSGLWGAHMGTSTEVSAIEGRDLDEIRLVKPKEAYAFRLFDRNVVKCEDGEIIRGERKNWSGYYYFGKGPFTEKELLESEQGEKYREDIQLSRDVHDYLEIQKEEEAVENAAVEHKSFPETFVITVNGRLRPLYPEDVIIPATD